MPAILPATFGVWLGKTRARARVQRRVDGSCERYEREKIERNVVMEVKEKERGIKGDGRLKHRGAAEHAECTFPRASECLALSRLRMLGTRLSPVATLGLSSLPIIAPISDHSADSGWEIDAYSPTLDFASPRHLSRVALSPARLA